MLLVIGIKNCNTIQKTLKWLEEKNIEFIFRDVKKDPLSDGELHDIVRKLSLETVINKRGTKWRSLGVSDKNLSDQDLFNLLAENQTMIKRPVILLDESVLIGFDEEALSAFLELD
jgi:Spx/MgsR family transcriptional regulator